MNEIVRPVIGGMAGEGYPFQGFLFVGLMLTKTGPKVIEFNVRLGDPETQALLPLVDEPLLPILMSAAAGELRQPAVRIARDCAVGVVVASRGYPESAESGQIITGVEAAEALPGITVFHAGTSRRNGDLLTNGGRVLTVVGRGADFGEAVTRAYDGVARISFDGMQYRRDIARSALARNR
jgi:phosphoribosylamine--glycine ligase